MLCPVDYIFNLLCAFNCLQPMKKFVFSVASRATGRLQIKPSGSGDENVPRRFRYFKPEFLFKEKRPKMAARTGMKAIDPNNLTIK